MVVAPPFHGTPKNEVDVIRAPALQNFNGSDFSVVLTPPRHLTREVDAFRPDIVHSHHPFLLGSTAMRLAHQKQVPLVFTHHTFYEHYTYYAPGDSVVLRRFVVRLCTNYANLSHEVFVPSESVAEILRQRQVKTTIRVVPNGIRLDDFEKGDGAGFRRVLGIPKEAVVVGHTGRLAGEKNLGFLARAVAAFLSANPGAHALIVGDGPDKGAIEAVFREFEAEGRARFTGTLQGSLLVSAYKAMSVFAFASLTETQGLVLTEAMAAGVPAVALDAPGVREVVRDGRNGRSLPTADEATFGDALSWIVRRPAGEAEKMRSAARATAQAFSADRTANRALAAYRHLIARPRQPTADLHGAWHRTARLLRSEWDLISRSLNAASSALR